MSDIKDFLPPNLALAADAFTQALLGAIDFIDAETETLIQACIDQLFLSTASGKYLVQQGEENGFTMPANSGLDIRAYEVLVPIMVSAPKQVRQTFNQMLEAFYGASRTRPSVTSSVAEPFNLSDGDDLIVETESGTFSVAVLATQVSNINSVSAAEAAAVLNAVQTIYTASVTTDRHSGNNFLTLTSSGTGSSAFIHVTGGTAQNVMQFPNLRPTTEMTGTVWNVTKAQTYTDVTKFQWDGVSPSPSVYLTKPGDFVTIRGLVDGAAPLSKLNGSYVILDCGYDYFVVSNTAFQATSGTITQPANNTIVFTASSKITIFDQPEFALTSETQFNTATITVPAIPPLARRFLQGSAHLHGCEATVLNFTRASVQVQLPAGATKPLGMNAFVLSNGSFRYDFSQPYYLTTNVDVSTNPIYTVDSSSGQALPSTTAIALGANPFFADIGRGDIVVTFPETHGLQKNWAFTVAGATGLGLFTTALLNREHVVKNVLNDTQVTIELLDSNGQVVLFDGNPFGTFDVWQQTTLQGDSDFFMRFPSSGAVAASGLQLGMKFRIDPSSGVNLQPYYGINLRFRDLYVTNITGTDVWFAAGLGAGPNGMVISGASGHSSAAIGGTPTWFFDQTTAWNVANVMTALKMVFVGYTPETNPNYVGSFLYDPLGVQYNQTVSGYISVMTQNILIGDNSSILFVQKVNSVFNGHNFPTSGQVVVDFGNDNFEGPINFLATISNDSGPSQILLDPSYRFKKSHGAGAQVQFIYKNQPFVPGIDGSAFPFYLTGTAQARNTLFTLLEELKASGIFLNANVILPQLKYTDLAISPFE